MPRVKLVLFFFSNMLQVLVPFVLIEVPSSRSTGVRADTRAPSHSFLLSVDVLSKKYHVIRRPRKLSRALLFVVDVFRIALYSIIFCGEEGELLTNMSTASSNDVSCPHVFAHKTHLPAAASRQQPCLFACFTNSASAVPCCVHSVFSRSRDERVPRCYQSELFSQRI